jgi:hypothetical protein
MRVDEDAFEDPSLREPVRGTQKFAERTEAEENEYRKRAGLPQRQIEQYQDQQAIFFRGNFEEVSLVHPLPAPPLPGRRQEAFVGAQPMPWEIRHPHGSNENLNGPNAGPLSADEEQEDDGRKRELGDNIARELGDTIVAEKPDETKAGDSDVSQEGEKNQVLETILPPRQTQQDEAQPAADQEHQTRRKRKRKPCEDPSPQRDNKRGKPDNNFECLDNDPEIATLASIPRTVYSDAAEHDPENATLASIPRTVYSDAAEQENTLEAHNNAF